MKMPWNRESVRILPTKIDLTHQPWCRKALLLHICGTGALRWEARTPPPDFSNYDSCRCLTLQGIPLLSGEFPVCETCESRLCTGWGLDRAVGLELDALREALNSGFTRLEDTIPALTPLLELLPEGIYVLAESDAYPADGSGRFFWDVPDRLKSFPATGAIPLRDDDYDCHYKRLPPVFLYPSQRRSRLDLGRVGEYRERLRQGGPLPHGIALHVAEGMSVLLDGHHKAAAAALLGRTLPCLTVLRLEYYHLRPTDTFKRSACFGPITIPVEEISGAKLPEKPWSCFQGSGALPEGRLEDAELPETLLIAGKRYPTAEGYALVSAAEIGYPTDRELARWLADPGLYRPQLRAALVLLRSHRDPRLKQTALRCAATEDRHCSLKTEAFQVLAELTGDPDAENFFIDYFVNLDGPPCIRGGAQEHLTEIAHSFWG